MTLQKDLEMLQQQEGSPKISILVPTKMAYPVNKENNIVTKTLVQRAKHKLLTTYSERDAKELIERLDRAEEDIDFVHTLNGVGIFIAPGFSKIIHIPFTPVESVTIDEHSFQVRDLVVSMNQMAHYWLLILSEQKTRLLVGYGTNMFEISDENFPNHYYGPGEGEDFPVRRGGKDHNYYMQKYIEQYVQQIDGLLFEYFKTEDIPLIVSGSEKLVSFFKERGRTAPKISKTLEGNFAKLTPHELVQVAEPIVKEMELEKREDILNKLEEAVGVQRYASGITNVWGAAKTGNAQTLIVSENYSTTGYLSADQYHLQLEGNGNNNENLVKLEDAVDDVVEMVLKAGGNVVFVPEGALSKHNNIAAIKRYNE